MGGSKGVRGGGVGGGRPRERERRGRKKSTNKMRQHKRGLFENGPLLVQGEEGKHFYMHRNGG